MSTDASQYGLYLVNVDRMNAFDLFDFIAFKYCQIGGLNLINLSISTFNTSEHVFHALREETKKKRLFHPLTNRDKT